MALAGFHNQVILWVISCAQVRSGIPWVLEDKRALRRQRQMDLWESEASLLYNGTLSGKPILKVARAAFHFEPAHGPLMIQCVHILPLYTLNWNTGL